ncbi:carbohydrate binding [Branchiostoma belcheri]|nr:carbohydrate binding [Branchiostoma belcheri]
MGLLEADLGTGAELPGKQMCGVAGKTDVRGGRENRCAGWRQRLPGEGDVVAKATNSSKVSVTLNSSGATRSARTYVNNGVNIVTTGMTPGDGLVAGMLDKRDVEEEYVSGASSTFTPFIVDPQRTMNNSERSLNGRLRKFEETFFISLLHDNPLTGPLEITIPINADLIPEGTVPVLLYWSTELQQWRDASRTCPNLDKNVQYDWEQNLLHVNVVYWTLYARTRSLYIPVHGRKWPCTAPGNSPCTGRTCRYYNPPPSRPKPAPLSGPVAPVPGTRCSHSRGPAFPVLGTPLHPLRGPPFPLPGLRCPAPEKSLPPLPGHISMF